MTCLTLPPVIDLAAATALAETLHPKDGPIALDGAAVDRIGVAGLQVLLSAQQSAVAAGHRLTIDHPSEALVAAARIAGADILLASAR